MNAKGESAVVQYLRYLKQSDAEQAELALRVLTNWAAESTFLYCLSFILRRYILIPIKFFTLLPKRSQDLQPPPTDNFREEIVRNGGIESLVAMVAPQQEPVTRMLAVMCLSNLCLYNRMLYPDTNILLYSDYSYLHLSTNP